MADNPQYGKNEVPLVDAYPQNQQPSVAFHGVQMNVQPPSYNTWDSYPQGGYGVPAVQTVTTQPPAAMATTYVIVQPPTQDRPYQGLAIGSLICAIVTLVLSGGGALCCAVPAIVLSALALGQDRVDQAKTMSLISLGLSAVYWVILVITVVIVVILFVVSANQVASAFDYTMPIPDNTWSDYNSYWRG